ncbi:restriction endonuclease [Rhodospira trueperi]|uniref:Restriction system protein n=1 Tax=Rhodospira trueperi TaxID=69960 RepID=A0A1G7A3M6_9PROT|nr:restriction endonuclease [Rhodospira trueperi]SDE08655.1 restriction system protein [Rhodospira trueperi]
MERGADSNVPSFDQLLWPTLVAVKEIGGSASNEEILARVIDVAGISDDVASVMHTDGRRTKVGYNLAWAQTYLKKVGALENSSRGVWALTEYGEHLKESDVCSIPNRVRQKYNKNKNDSKSHDPNNPRLDLPASPDEIEGSDQAESWKDSLLSAIRAMEPAAFERLAQRLLRESGFVRVNVTGRSGDGGIDGVGVLRLNLLSFHVLFQCKRYSGSVGAREVRDFRGAMIGRSDKGLLITTGTFTSEAKKEAARDGAPPLELIDGDNLCKMMKELKLGVRVEFIEAVVVDEEWIQKI